MNANKPPREMLWQNDWPLPFAASSGIDKRLTYFYRLGHLPFHTLIEVFMHKAIFVIASASLAASISLSGCSAFDTRQPDVAAVTSNPSGATVYASGLILGKTPLQHDLYEAFPASWSGGAYQARGVLTLKSDGCEEYTLKINDYILSQPIHADLKCSATNDDGAKTTAILTTAKPAENALEPSAENSIEQRIKKLDALYKKGVITQDEYTKNRERILSDL